MSDAQPSIRRMVAETMGLLATFAVLRAATLWKLPPYFDESFYALQSYAATIDPSARFAALADGKGPLFNWLGMIPIAFGAEPLTAVRLIAALATAATVVLVGVLAARVTDRSTALMAMGIYAILPLVFVEGSMGFYEPLVACFATAALVVQVDLAERPTLRAGMLLGLALGAGLLTKPTGQLVILLLPLGLLVPATSGSRFGRWTGTILVALMLSAVSWAIMASSPLFFEPHRGLQYTPPLLALRLAPTILPAAWPAYRTALASYVTLPILGVAGVGLAFRLAVDARRTSFLVLWSIAGMAASMLIASKPLVRYLLPWIAPLAVFAADGTSQLVAWTGRRTVVAAVLALLLLLPALQFDVAFTRRVAAPELPGYDDRELVTDWPAGTGLRRLTDLIASRADADAATIAFVPAGTSNPSFAILLNDPGGRRFTLVDASDPRAGAAQFVVEASTPFVPALPGRIDAARYRLLDTVERPRLGATLRLFERMR